MLQLRQPKLRIQASSIHGLGVFAHERIPAGEKLSFYTGVEMSHADFKAKYGKNKQYVYQRAPWLPLIVAKDNRNLITYVNSNFGTGLDRNCVLKSRWLIPLRDLEAGEELLLEYPKNYFKFSE